MSLVGIFGPMPQSPGKSGGSASTESLRDLGRRPGDAPRELAPAPTGGAGAAAPAEATQAAARVPPPTPSRAANPGAASRSGGDGGDTTALAREALADAARFDAGSDADEARARRDAEVAQERLIAQEILSRIPVPVEALPRLAVEAQRVVEDINRPERPARSA